MMNWSYSKWGAFKKCPASFDYRYNQKIPTPKNVYAQRGVDKHAILEEYLLGKTKELPHPLGYYQSFIDSLREQGATAEELFCFNENFERVDKDHPDIWFKAVADVVLVLDALAYVYDWKTGKIYDDHRDQRELYALCVFKSYPSVEQVNGIHTYIDLFENRSTTYYRAEMADLEAKWRERADSILSAKLYPQRRGYYCSFCPFSKRVGGPCQY